MAGKAFYTSCRSAGDALLVLIVATAGCGGREATYPVAVTVQFADGAPVPFGTVEFRERATGRIARGKLGPTGRFVLGTFAAADGAIPGAYQVIVVQHLFPDQTREPAVHHAPADADDGDHSHRSVHGDRPRLVAAKHADYATSGLAAEVRPDAENEVLITVESQ